MIPIRYSFTARRIYTLGVALDEYAAPQPIANINAPADIAPPINSMTMPI